MTVQLNFTPSTSLDLVKEYFPTTWPEEIDLYTQMLCAVAISRKKTVSESFFLCMQQLSDMGTIIRMEAALKILITPTLLNQEIKALENELQQAISRSYYVENTCRSTVELGFTRKALYRNIERINQKLYRLLHAQQDLADIEVEGEIIKPDGSEETL